MMLNFFEVLTHERTIFIAMLSCGFYTSYTDFRYGRIANIYTLVLIVFGIISQVIFVSAGEITWIHSCVTFFGGLGLAFVMFYIGIWAAGDSKLFWGISLLIPPSAFSRTPETQFYPLILLVNIFFLFLGYVILKFIFRTTLQQQQAFVSKSFIAQVKQFPRRLLQMLSYIGVGGLAFYIPTYMQIELDLAVRIILFIIIIFAFNKFISMFIPKKYEIVFYIPFLFLAFFLAIPSMIQLGYFFVFVFFFSWFLILFGSVIYHLFTREVPVENLHPKMIPAEKIIEMRQKDVANRYVKVETGFANPAQENVIVDISSEGLTQKQIKHLTEKSILNDLEGKLRIQDKIPFAFMIVLGALVTLLAKGMIYSFVQSDEVRQLIKGMIVFF